MLMVAGALLVLVGVILVITLVVNNHESDLESKYSATVQQIISLSMKENEGYDRLALLCNMFGHRITGSSGLEKATTHVYESMIEDGFSNVQYDDVLVSDWRRGDSSLQMTAPYVKKMNVLALGYSVPTDGILEAGVIVVGSFDELKEKSDLGLVEGRIVVYNVPFLSSYGGIVSYRTQGAAQAAKYGAVASLTRSITPYSLDTPHTGVQYYEDNQTAIPAAAITVEDAQLLQYLQVKGFGVLLSICISTLPVSLLLSQCIENIYNCQTRMKIFSIVTLLTYHVNMSIGRRRRLAHYSTVDANL